MTPSLDLRIRAAAADLLGMRYERQAVMPCFPKPQPGLPSIFVGADATHINCSSTTAYILCSVYGHRVPDPRQLYKDLQITGSDLWSPIHGVERQGIGLEVQQPTTPGWYLVQLWNDPSDPSKGGHACLLFVAADGTHQVLESIKRDGVGPGWRRTTWAQLTRGRHAKVAALRP